MSKAAKSAVKPKSPAAKAPSGQKQLLHLVFGGELKDLDSIEFRDLAAIDMVGLYPNYAEAERAWRAKAQATIDNAHMRYFIVHLHRLLDPDEDHSDGGH